MVQFARLKDLYLYEVLLPRVTAKNLKHDAVVLFYVDLLPGQLVAKLRQQAPVGVNSWGL